MAEVNFDVGDVFIRLPRGDFLPRAKAGGEGAFFVVGNAACGGRVRRGAAGGNHGGRKRRDAGGSCFYPGGSRRLVIKVADTGFGEPGRAALCK